MAERSLTHTTYPIKRIIIDHKKTKDCNLFVGQAEAVAPSAYHLPGGGARVCHSIAIVVFSFACCRVEAC